MHTFYFSTVNAFTSEHPRYSKRGREGKRVRTFGIHYEIAYLIGLDEKVIITVVVVQPKVNKLNINTEETSAKIKGHNI